MRPLFRLPSLLQTALRLLFVTFTMSALLGCDDSREAGLASPSAPLRLIVDPPDGRVGVNVGLLDPPSYGNQHPEHQFPTHEGAGAYLSLTKRAGIRWVRLSVEGRDVLTNGVLNPNNGDLARLDFSVSQASDSGFNILLVLAHLAYAEDTQTWVFPDSSTWTSYVAQMADRYPQVRYFSIWNEPNVRTSLRGAYDWSRSANGYEYAALVKQAALVLHPRGRFVVAGENEWSSNPTTDKITKSATFLQDLLDAAGSDIDIVSLHSYGKPDSAVHAARVIMASTPYSSKPLWLTEFGHSDPHASVYQQDTVTRTVLLSTEYTKAFAWHQHIRIDTDTRGMLIPTDSARPMGEEGPLVYSNPILSPSYRTIASLTGSCNAGFARGSVEYRAWVEGASNWTLWSADSAVVGTTGQSNALVKIQMRLRGARPCTSIEYRIRNEWLGWGPWTRETETAAFSNLAPIHQFQARLTGADASNISVCYYSFVTGHGWLDSYGPRCDGSSDTADYTGWGFPSNHPIEALVIWLRARP